MTVAIVVEDADAHCDWKLVAVCDREVGEMMGWNSVGGWVDIGFEEEGKEGRRERMESTGSVQSGRRQRETNIAGFVDVGNAALCVLRRDFCFIPDSIRWSNCSYMTVGTSNKK